MRNPQRLDLFYSTLCQIHKNTFPDWRFGQFLMNFLSWYGKDPFYLEEEDFLSNVERYITSLKEG